MKSSCTVVFLIDGGAGSWIGEKRKVRRKRLTRDGKGYAFNIFSAAICASCTQSPMPMPL